MPQKKHILKVFGFLGALSALLYVGLSFDLTSGSTGSITVSLVSSQFSSISIPTSSQASSISIPTSSQASSISIPTSSQASSISIPTSSQASSISIPTSSQASSISIPTSSQASSVSIPTSSRASSVLSSTASSGISTTSRASIASSAATSRASSTVSIPASSAGSVGSTGSRISTVTGNTGGQGGTGGGNIGGFIGGSFGGLGGIGGTGGSPGGGGSVGGSRPLESAKPAKAEDCITVGDKLKRNCIPLVQPLGNNNVLTVKPGAETFFDYFNEAASLLLTVAIGFCVLWILIGSYFIMVSGSDGGKRATGQSIITWAIIGLILVNFAGFFLRTLNSVFFI